MADDPLYDPIPPVDLRRKPHESKPFDFDAHDRAVAAARAAAPPIETADETPAEDSPADAEPSDE